MIQAFCSASTLTPSEAQTQWSKSSLYFFIIPPKKKRKKATDDEFANDTDSIGLTAILPTALVSVI